MCGMANSVESVEREKRLRRRRKHNRLRIEKNLISEGVILIMLCVIKYFFHMHRFFMAMQVAMLILSVRN